MSLLFERGLGDTPNELVPNRQRVVGNVTVSPDSAMRASAVWAALRLRADLISSLPLKSYRQVGGLEVEVAPTPFLRNPGGDRYGQKDWVYASQVELDRTGNCFGIIEAYDALGLPAVVCLVPTSSVTVKGCGPTVTGYQIHGTSYTPSEVWHERQFPIPGVPLGLSPTAAAAMSVGAYLSAQQFALDWFRNGAVPGGVLKNEAQTVSPGDADVAKLRFKSAVENRDLFVVGKDWSYDMMKVTANESQFIETMNYGIQDIARFYGVPGDMIDAPAESSAKITYANITQRNLQLLVLHLGPAIARREAALSAALPKPRFVQFDVNAFLRMDPQTQSAMLGQQVTSRLIAPSEGRAVLNRTPFTESQMAEFDRLFGTRNPTPAPTPAPGVPNE